MLNLITRLPLVLGSLEMGMPSSGTVFLQPGLEETSQNQVSMD